MTPDTLLARIAATEAVARAATPGPWRVDAEGLVRSHYAMPGSDYGWTTAETWTHPDENAAHIAAWDPARVLAVCAGAKTLVELAYQHAATIDGEWGCCHDEDAIRTGVRKAAGDWEDDEPLPEGCYGPEAAAPFLAAVAAMFAEPGEES